MKRHLFGALIAACFVSPAAAADMGTAVSPSFDWTGAYVGVNVGWAWSDGQATDLTGYNVPGERYAIDDDGFIGGVQAGYNWQFDQIVVGVEADLGYVGLDKTVVQPGSPGGDTRSTIDANYQLALSARLGLAIDKTLIYAKGGFAYLNADVATVDSCTAVPCGAGLLNSRGDDFTGYTIGAGVEHAFTPNWTAKLEYAYTDFGSVRTNSPTGVRYDFDLNMHTLKVGLNYKF